MDTHQELMGSLSGSFKCNKARLFCLSGMLLALITVRIVNLREIAVAFASEALLASRYRRLRRFFALFKIDYLVVARWIFSLYFADKEKIYLTIDRTNWYWGKAKINVLTLGVVCEGVAIPLFWQALDKAGNASAKEHCGFIEKFINAFGAQCIAGVNADREFGSHELFSWCNDQEHKIPFYIRIKDNALARIPKCKGRGHSVKHVFNSLKANEQASYPYPIILYGSTIYVANSRSENGELMVVATNQPVHNAIIIYIMRWEIETLFSCLKERGFNFEDTHMTHPERIEKIMAVLAMAVAWVHKVGEWRRPFILSNLKDLKVGSIGRNIATFVMVLIF